jgi:hypothetical protein
MRSNSELDFAKKNCIDFAKKIVTGVRMNV